MTGGKVVILGSIGRNFGAGMSGGVAYIYKKSLSDKNFNMNMIEIESLDDHDNIEILNMIKNHYSYTNSEIAEKLLSDWDVAKKLFVKVMPIEYKNALKKIKEQKIAELMNK